MERFSERYRTKAIPALTKEFNYTNPMQVPRLKKIVLNCGVGEATQNAKAIEYAVYALTQIAGQKPIVTKARKSIANFKLRAGVPIGCCVTLRRSQMEDFFDKLIWVALPRVKDFRGMPRRGFDGRGSYTVGLKEQIVFPEIDIDQLDKIRGMDITFVTSAKTDEEGRALLRELGLPFRN
ncbi:MAG: 50S ribosomal protein L5 [Bdellovibrionota bacterium]|jgi:large subunit ribosomal protein L5